MRKTAILLAMLCALGLAAGGAKAQTSHTETLTWTWPTLRADGVTALPLSQIGSIAIYDSAAAPPAPGVPGVAIPCNAGTMPPTAATGSCTTGGLTSGQHNFTAVVSDNASPANPGAASSVVTVTVPLAGPAAVSNFVGTLH